MVGKLASITLLMWLSLAGCKAPKTTADAKQTAAEKPLIADGRGLLFSFFDEQARLRTVERIADVAPVARAQVMVTDPLQTLSDGQVFVADLRKKTDGNRYAVWRESKGSWLDRNMPKLSELKQPIIEPLATKTPLRHRPRRTRRRRPRAKKPPADSASVAEPRVVMFSTSWCPSCKKARAYFAGRGVPFVEKDVEKDQQAAAAYQQIAEKLGLRRGVVPLIIVGKQVFQGFSEPQISAALAGQAS